MVSVMQLLFSAVRTFVQVAFLASFVFWHRVGPTFGLGFYSAARISYRAREIPVCSLTQSHPLRSGILALCNKRWLEVFLRNRVEFTAMLELTLDLLNYRLLPFVQQFQ